METHIHFHARIFVIVERSDCHAVAVDMDAVHLCRLSEMGIRDRLNGLGVITVSDTADAIREHSLKGNGLLCRLRNTVVLLCPFQQFSYKFEGF